MYIDREKRTGGGERERASPDHARLILTCFVRVTLTLSENLARLLESGSSMVYVPDVGDMLLVGAW